MIWLRNILLLVVMTTIISCGNAGKRGDHSSEGGTDEARYALRIPQAPPALQGEAAAAYLRDNWWREFDFGDTLQLQHFDKNEFARFFARYTMLLPADGAYGYMSELMQKASLSKPMFDYFMLIAEGVLHDPNSELRDDEKYIPILEAALQSDYLDEYEKAPYRYDLNIARQNRMGQPANDFAYTTADGRTSRLYELRAEHILIFISNPGCGMCGDVKDRLLSSPIVTDRVSRGELKVLVIYPDEDLTAWREGLNDYPSQWINAYDKGGVITRDNLYDLRAIPALYLLDAEKCVLAKDCTDVGFIEKLIADSQ